LVLFGEKLGHAFQIVDDLLDVSGAEAKVGKRLGKDRQRGKVTYPSLLGVEKSRAKAAELIDEACGAIESFGAAAGPLRELAEFVGRRSR
jgi:geranylgeranyl diphosphate synthase type II